MKRSELAEAWCKQARHYLEAARFLREEGYYDTCAFTCLMSAEWAVKALWLDMKRSVPAREPSVEQFAEQLGAPSGCLRAASVLAKDELAMYPRETGQLPSDYTREDADDRLHKAESVIAWADAQWEHDDNA